MKPVKPENCSTCQREVFLNFHHLIPKKMHGKRPIKALHPEKDFDHYGVWLCRDCHSKIHRLFTHKQLAETHYTLERIMEDEEFSKFLVWVKKQKKRVK